MNSKKIIELLSPHMSDERKERLARTVELRSRYVTTVLEKPYDVGNINAAMRSAEAFGFQDFHIIEGPKRLRPTGRTSGGAGKWLSVHKWQSSKECLEQLKTDGFQIVSTAGDSDMMIDDVDFNSKTAIVFGSEHAGISDDVRELSDHVVCLPITGMVESFNLSVAVALSLYASFTKIDLDNNRLSEVERVELLADFYQRSVPNSRRILDNEEK